MGTGTSACPGPQGAVSQQEEGHFSGDTAAPIEAFGSSGLGCSLHLSKLSLSSLQPDRVSLYPLNFAILPLGHFRLVT